MVVQAASIETRREREHTKAGELRNFHQSICQIFSSMYLSHPPDWFLHGLECVVFSLYPQCPAQCPAHKHTATTQKYLPKRAHETHQWWLQSVESGLLREGCCYWERANSLVGRSLQPNKHTVILNNLYIFQLFFLEKSTLGNGLNFACNFLSNARVQ